MLSLIHICTFYGNSAALGRGGAIYTGMDGKVINCTFTGNRAFNGGGFYGHNAGKMYTLINTICYNNIDENETGDIRRNNEMCIRDRWCPCCQWCDYYHN